MKSPTHIKELLLVIVLLIAHHAVAEPKTSNAPFLKPEEAVAKMDIAKEFEVKVFAAEPDIGEPIAFTFDDRGRIWVVENYNYVNRREHTDKQVTRIQILEDTDSDGVFDSKKLFTDQLTFSSGIAVGFGGVFVGSPPNLTFIPDANGDDKPDGPPEILLDGWGIQDRHETLNSFIWGPDGWLYGCHGVFTQSMVGKPGTPEKQRQFIDGGIWRWHPTKKKFEVFASGLSNPWGFDFNDVGQGFASCCVIPHIFHVVQGGVYHKQSRPHVNPYIYDDIKTIRDHEHRSAHGGARFYLADAFPKKYRNRLFMCNIHQHQVLTDIVKPKGSSYVASHGDDFLTTNDLAWVGFSVQTGPEGAVYILDWHDTDICGNTINFPDSGRIYRILPKEAKPIKRPNLRKLSDAQLVALQMHPNDWYVRQSRLQLQMRSAAGKLDQKIVHSALDKLLIEAPNTGKRLRALWALHVTAGLNQERLFQLLKHQDEYVRAWTVQLLCENKKPSKADLVQFEKMATSDSSPIVRLYLSCALQRIPFEQRWPILAKLSQHQEDIEDNNIPRMLWFALEPMVPVKPEKSLKLAIAGKIPKLQEFTARRLVSGDLSEVSQKEKAAIRAKQWRNSLQRLAPSFAVRNVGEGGVIYLDSFRNQTAVQTKPKNRNRPCEIFRWMDVLKNQTTHLKIRASYHPHGDWKLRVRVGKKVLHEQIVSYQTVQKEWLDLDIDLSQFAGQNIQLIIENRSGDMQNDYAYWGSIKIEQKLEAIK